MPCTLKIFLSGHSCFFHFPQLSGKFRGLLKFMSEERFYEENLNIWILLYLTVLAYDEQGKNMFLVTEVQKIKKGGLVLLYWDFVYFSLREGK